MSFYDLLIIYLACGAPLGVYYFFQNRRVANRNSLWLKTFVNFLFWIPFAFQILLENKIFGKLFNNIFERRENTDSDIEKRIAPLGKSLETAIIKNIPQSAENIPKFSVFEVREILERYTGLTLACQIEQKNSQIARTENEFYKIFAYKNGRLASICAARRNRERLFFHQTEARRDFLNLIGKPENENLQRQIIEFVEILKDFEAHNALEKMFTKRAQTEKSESVKTTEKVLWKSETRKPLPINQTASARLKLSPATMNLRAKD